MEELLYHYTCEDHLDEILSSKLLKLSPSNLIMPDGTIATEKRSAAYKPVVWLTDSELTSKMGLDGSSVDKTEIKVYVKKKDYMIRWDEWQPQKEMDERWRSVMFDENQFNTSTWYISEQEIPFEDIVRIENRYDGTIYYGEPNPDFKRIYNKWHGPKIYPNDPCPCGSGKKFKRCCAKNV